MLRSDHFYYDMRAALGSTKFLVGVLVVVLFLILYISTQFILLGAVLFATIFGVRGIIGRRCPTCDRPLKEVSAERDPDSVFVMWIVWQCPKDGYTEREKTKGDSGLFGTGS